MFETYDPLVKEEIAKFRAFQKRFIPDPGNVLVFSGEGKDLLIVPQGKPGPTFGELIWQKYNLLYKVDITEHLLKFCCQLPCATDAFFFDAEVVFSCSVNNPEMIVRREVRDVRSRLEPLIVEVMRGKSRNYTVGESGIAESDISDSIKSVIYDSGFQVTNLVLKLGLSKEAADYVQNLERINREKELTRAHQELENQKKEFERNQRLKQEEEERQRQFQKAELEREIKEREEAFKFGTRLRDSEFSLKEQKSQQELDFERRQKETAYLRQDKKLDAETEQQIELDKVRNQEWLAFEREKQAFEREKLQLEREKLRLQAANDMLQLQQSIERQKNDFALEAKIIEEYRLLEAKQSSLQLQQAMDSQEQEFVREADKLDLESKIRRENIALEARSSQLDRVQEISAKERDFELDSMTRKMETYKPIIQGGRWELLALSLSQNPEDVQFVMNEMNRQRESDRTSWVQAVELLLKNGALEGHELEETAKNMLQGMVSVMRQNTIGLGSEASAGSLAASDDDTQGSTLVTKYPDNVPKEFQDDDAEVDDVTSTNETTVSTVVEEVDGELT